MFRESGDARTNFVLFSYAGKFLKEQSVRVGDINNIWLLIPLGTGLYRWFQKKWVLLIPFVMSVAIETTQYITGLGIAEFDDVFGNTMGGWIGILVAYIIMMWRSEMVDHHLPRRPILWRFPLHHPVLTSRDTVHIDGSTLGILALCRHRTLDRRRICFYLDRCVLRLQFWVDGM